MKPQTFHRIVLPVAVALFVIAFGLFTARELLAYRDGLERVTQALTDDGYTDAVVRPLNDECWSFQAVKVIYGTPRLRLGTVCRGDVLVRN